MARSVFYYHLRQMNEGRDKYECERSEIKSIFYEHKERYGYRRVTDEMHNRGYAINHKTVLRIMKALELKCRIRKVRYRSYKGEVGRIAPNVLGRDFKADRPCQKWATDVTQVRIKEDKCYISPILDMFNGEIVAYQISDRPNLKMVTDTKAKMGKKPVIVVLNTGKPVIPAEFEGKADAILVSFGVQNQAIFDIISGKAEPSGLLPMQMPANMKTVEEQNEDVPRDMICYKDADGNTYDYAFGMNWSGVINDARVAAYK